MSPLAMVKPRHRYVLDYLTTACEAALRGETEVPIRRGLIEVYDHPTVTAAVEKIAAGEQARAGA